MHYLIDESLTPCAPEELHNADRQFVAVLTPQQWAQRRGAFELGIDIDPDPDVALGTQAEVNYDAITGTVLIPDRTSPDAPDKRFAFALDEKGVVFIDAQETATGLVAAIAAARRWRRPGLERFLADFLMQIIKDDAALLRGYERELDRMEDAILDDTAVGAAERINDMRSELRDLDSHYDHLMDLTQILEENENGFFREEDLRYFRTVYGRLDKLRDQASSLRDQTLQMRDLYKMHLDVRQNHIMAALTIVTAIFAPLTLIVGWYGMNFEHMPELAWPWSYPAVALLSVVVVIGCIAFFKHRKWL
ncbi:CorA family divalent cation transporter [Actinomyces sp. 565]|uniref:CorA family divalent cation transporter n=1 Tax=Actinomyces sp. 565 TaxID=2057794 RepID=UPI0013A6ABBC|nr:magnesium transporter CorA [Actinomyces sp. 565]